MTHEIPEIKNLLAKHKALNKELYTHHDLSGISYKILSNWVLSGVLEDRRDNTSGRRWNYFNAIDLVLIGVLQRLKAMRFTRNHLKACSKMLSDPISIPSAGSYSTLAYTTMLILSYNHPAYLVASFDEKEVLGFYLLDEKAYFAKLKKMEITSHCAILLNSVLKEKLPPLYRQPDFDIYVGLSSEEIAILDQIKKKNVISLNITLRDGKVKTLEGTQRVIDPVEIAQLMQTDGYDTITLKRKKGTVLAAHRTTRKNF